MKVVLLAGVGSAAAYFWWYMQGPGRSLASMLADLGGYLGGSIRLSESQQDSVRVIEQVFRAKNLDYLTRAAVVNAYAESRLDPTAQGDWSDKEGRYLSIGLFQLHERGAGKGMSIADRMDPGLNAIAIAEEAVRRGASAHRAASETDKVIWFAREVERCWACGHGGGSSELDHRAALYSRIFGA